MKKIIRFLAKISLLIKPVVFPAAASFLVAFCWNWYHLSHNPPGRWWFLFFLTWIIIFCVYFFGKKLLVFIAQKTSKNIFAGEEFLSFLDDLFLIGSGLFLVFLSRYELLNLFYFALILILFFCRFDHFLSHRLFSGYWRQVGRMIFLLAFFIFFITAFFQYFAYAFYILDPNIKYYNIVLFRSWAMTMFWLAGFSAADLLYQKFSGRIKNFFTIFWAFAFIASLFLGFANVGILYYSGLYFSPVVWDHTGGGSLGTFYKAASLLVFLFIFLTIAFILIFKKYIQAHHKIEGKYWRYYNFAVLALALFSFLSVASLKNTPEAMILKSFWQEWCGQTRVVDLNDAVQTKLKKFGINHNLNEFYVNQSDKVFSEPLSDNFKAEKPNVMILFLESFSARLTGVYNEKLPGVTPALEDFSKNPRTTVFTNYYNASTPTITGLISELCSFLPPTGHEEIETEKKLQKHHLLCLPEVLKENGYKTANYFTAVDKEYANKDSIMASMGMDKVIGEKEYSELITGEPLSWGYSDHQTLPIVWQALQTAEEPFLFAWSSVDSHPPFDRVKDVVKYQEGDSRVLNAVHTTDDAFGKFWNEFQNSRFYDNTVLIVVADHAVFPTAYDSTFFPDEAGKMNYYDQTTFLLYSPKEILPRTVDTFASGLDFTPSVLHLLNINIANPFEGLSIFESRKNYPNLLGMHEFGLYVNEEINGARRVEFAVPNDLDCADEEISVNPNDPLSLCEYYNYFQWKRQAFEEGRFWRKPAN